MKNILVGIDFHENVESLIARALEFSKPYNSKIWLLHAAAPEPDFIGYEVGPQYIRDFRAQALRREHKQLIDQAKALKEKGYKAEGLLIQGTAIDVIVEEAEKLKIDLIIFGNHHHGLLYKLFFGSLSSEIMERVNIPVLILPLSD